MRRKVETEWLQAEGQPKGVEYSLSGDLLSVRVWGSDWYREAGPIHLMGGSVDVTVRQLLREMNYASPKSPH